MSMDVLKEFLIAIGVKVDTAQLAAVDAAVDKTAISAVKLDASATAASTTLSSKLAPALGALLSPLTLVTAAIGEAYHAMFGFIQKSAEGFERISHLANRVNTTADAVQKLGYIAQFTRSSVAAAESSLDGLNRAAGEAYLGVGRAKKIFDKIGLSVKDSNGQLKDTSKLMGELSEKIKPLQRGEQLAVLEKLGIDKTMIEALTTDTSKLAAENDQLYKAFGLNVDKASESSVGLIDAMGKVKRVFDVFKDAIASAFFDQFKDGFDSFRQQLLVMLPKLVDGIKPVIIAMTKIGSIILTVGTIFATVAGEIVSAIQKINDATGGWAVKIAAATYAWNKLNLAFLRSPIGIIIELATAFALLYDDYKTWEKGGKSFINWGNESGRVIFNVIFALGTLVTMIYSVNAAMKLARGIQAAYTAALVIFETTVTKARAAVELLSTAMEFGFVGAYATLGLMIADIVLLIQKVKELTSLFHQLNETKSGTQERSNVLKKHAGILSFLPGGVLGASLYNPVSAKLAPSPSTAGTIANNKHVTINQKTDIHVNGAGDPYAVGTAVKNAQRQTTGEQFRNMQGAIQ